MSQPKLSGRKIIVLSALSLCSGLVGILIGRTYAAALKTDPAWAGPAVLAGSIALLLVGVLSAPAAVRALRRK
ncbi:hypothetical protein U6S59_12160 [Cutibacterium acnes]